MRKYNFIRPLFILIIAYLVNNIVTNVCMMFGMSAESASNIGFTAMLIAAVITFTRLNKKRNS